MKRLGTRSFCGHSNLNKTAANINVTSNVMIKKTYIPQIAKEFNIADFAVTVEAFFAVVRVEELESREPCYIGLPFAVNIWGDPFHSTLVPSKVTFWLEAVSLNIDCLRAICPKGLFCLSEFSKENRSMSAESKCIFFSRYRWHATYVRGWEYVISLQTHPLRQWHMLELPSSYKSWSKDTGFSIGRSIVGLNINTNKIKLLSLTDHSTLPIWIGDINIEPH